MRADFRLKKIQIMKILFTLDYELFLGNCTGSVEHCLIAPMNRLCEVADKYNLKFTVFVDATYLVALKNWGEAYPSLKNDLKSVSEHLQHLHENGHDIQLHIHPQWSFSRYDGEKWIMDCTHYKLSDLSEKEACTIFDESKTLLESIVGKKVIAFRAGGFSAQPTSMLTHLMDKFNLRIDSSVFSHSQYDSPQQQYDYRSMPNKSSYYFDKDICREEEKGRYMEIPITTYYLSPVFNWKLALSRIVKTSKHKNYGDGISVETTKSSIVKRLTRRSYALITIDGYKISYLSRAVRKCKEKEMVTIIGHPKLVTPFSVREFDKFCASNRVLSYCTISSLYE